MSVQLPAEQVAAIRAHGRRAYPHECCGALLGEPDPSSPDGKAVRAALPAGNERGDSPRNRFLISSAEVRRMEAEARRRGLSIVGFYHSHPDHPARPSEYDREHAWPWYSYVILEVRGGRDAALRSWRLTDDRQRFEEEPLHETLEEPA
ncbi:MAG TPA: M67 family metallopeptidase [Gemmatimonadota bacterium]|jgi:proteasome lid subunit RPN8/RPN11